MRDLDIIRNTAILRGEDFAFLSTVADELQDTLTKRQIFRTETEMRVSVLNDIKHPTAASKYWQAVREQAGMFESLVQLGLDYRRNEVSAKRIAKRLSEATDPFDAEELQIDLDECDYKRTNMELVAKDRIRELRLWSELKSELDDGSFDTKDVNTHQLVSYTKRFLAQSHVAGKDLPLAEAMNLYGQLHTALSQAKKQGVSLLENEQ